MVEVFLLGMNFRYVGLVSEWVVEFVDGMGKEDLLDTRVIIQVAIERSIEVTLSYRSMDRPPPLMLRITAANIDRE